MSSSVRTDSLQWPAAAGNHSVGEVGRAEPADADPAASLLSAVGIGGSRTAALD
jgi:hypothetical protein